MIDTIDIDFINLIKVSLRLIKKKEEKIVTEEK